MQKPGESKIRVLIADDEPVARDSLTILLSPEADMDVIALCADGKEAAEAIVNNKPDLVFLDIQMPEMNGFDVLEAIRHTYIPTFIFVTAFDQYALQAFEQSACDYLLKPYDDERFYKSLEKARHWISASRAQERLHQLNRLLNVLQPAPPPLSATPVKNTYPQKITIKNNRRISFLAVATILSIESEGNFIKIHTQDGMKIGSYSFKQIQAILDPAKFIRIHKSFIVNTDFIDYLEPHFHGDYIIYMKDGTKLKLSRNYKDSFDQLIS